MPRFTFSFTALLEKVAPVTPSTWTVAGFHAIPFVEQTLSYFIEVVGSLLVGKRLNLYYLSFLDIDRKGRIATKSFYVFTQRGSIDDVSTVSFLGHYLRV